ncbi:MAG: hypothetical protein IJR50_05685 [Treponema sp.]|nr:hypothetical protein [Treponema sp.]
MKRKILMATWCLSCAVAAFAYNPPISGESLDRIVSPTQLTAASSSAGGGIFNIGPDAIVFNPALIAYEQRITLDAAYTQLFSVQKNNNRRLGWTFQGGFLIPSKWFVASGILKGTFLPIDEMRVGNIISTNVAIAKEVSERISVGFGINGGFFWGAGPSWSLGASLGVLYRRPTLGFMKDFRVGASVIDLGKNYMTALAGIYGNKPSGMFPMLGTTHVGVAALLFSTDYVKGGASLELIAPGFQNLIVATGFHFAVNDALYIRIAEEINVRETVAGYANYMPSVSLGYCFSFKSKKSNYLASNGWSQSEMTANAAWQQLYKTVHAVSANVKINLGMRDTEPPRIELWMDEEDE